MATITAANIALVDQNGNKVDLNAVQPDEQFNRSKFFTKSRDLSRISFVVDYDLSNFKNGIYDLMIEMQTEDNDQVLYDIVQLKDYQNSEYEKVTVGEKEMQFVVSKDRNRMQLIVDDKIKE